MYEIQLIRSVNTFLVIIIGVKCINSSDSESTNLLIRAPFRSTLGSK